MHFLIIGTGRCGTGYMAKSLQASGLDIGHEKWGRDGTSDWHYAAPKRPFPSFVKHYKTLHIVRHPLRCADSFQTTMSVSWQFIANHIPLNLEDPLEVRCLRHWLLWNQLCRNMADLSVQIEQIDQPEVHEFFERRIDFGKVSTNYNSRTYTPINWKAVFEQRPKLANDVSVEAEFYGYTL